MDKNTEKRMNSALISDSARDSAKVYQRENLQTRRKMEDDFFNKSLDYRDFVFSPEGYEGIVLSLYIMIIPYLAGLSFLFLFVAEASYEYFLQFNLTSFFVIWAIGYEVCAATILLSIFLIWLNQIKNRVNKEQARKKPPTNHYGY
jgi:cellulose synthase/poly-beta-1,6-N-acetylglucosamine synthase-like glycosyltransferase